MCCMCQTMSAFPVFFFYCFPDLIPWLYGYPLSWRCFILIYVQAIPPHFNACYSTTCFSAPFKIAGVWSLAPVYVVTGRQDGRQTDMTLLEHHQSGLHIFPFKLGEHVGKSVFSTRHVSKAWCFSFILCKHVGIKKTILSPKGVGYLILLYDIMQVSFNCSCILAKWQHFSSPDPGFLLLSLFWDFFIPFTAFPFLSHIAFSFSSLLNASRLPSGANPVGDVSRKADYLLERHDFWRKFTHT